MTDLSSEVTAQWESFLWLRLYLAGVECDCWETCLRVVVPTFNLSSQEAETGGLRI